VERGEEKVVVKFSGNFCKTCGLYDWLEDMIYELKEIDPELDAEIIDWRQVSENKVITRFKLRKSLRND